MTSLKTLVSCFVGAACLAGASPADAQNAPQAPSVPVQKQVVPLKLQIVLSRYDGEKKIESLPFTLMVNANDTPGAQLNMETQVAVPQTMMSTAEGAAIPPPVTSFSYKPIGTSIAADAKGLDDGRFTVLLSLRDSLVLPGKPGEQAKGVPSFQTFTSINRLLLKDGQSIQYATATDPVSGRVTKVDVTLTVVK